MKIIIVPSSGLALISCSKNEDKIESYTVAKPLANSMGAMGNMPSDSAHGGLAPARSQVPQPLRLRLRPIGVWVRDPNFVWQVFDSGG